MKDGIVFNGPIIVDKHLFVDYFPKESLLSNVNDTSQQLGGIANVMFDYHKLDPKIPLIINSTLGDDSECEYVKKKFSEVIPNTDLSKIKIDERTPFTIVVNSSETKQRTFFSYTGSFHNFDKSYIDWDNIEGKIFLLEYIFIGKKLNTLTKNYGSNAGEILYKAKQKGFITAIDFATTKIKHSKEIAKSVFKYTDICALNEVEAEYSTGIKINTPEGIDQKNIIKALLKIKDEGVSTWIVLHSAEINFGLDCKTGKIYKVTSLKIPKNFIKGTVGAGDAFFSGILYGVYHDLNITDSMQLAIAVAACSLSKINGTDGIKSITKVKELFDKYKGLTIFEEIKYLEVKYEYKESSS